MTRGLIGVIRGIFRCTLGLGDDSPFVLGRHFLPATLPATANFDHFG